MHATDSNVSEKIRTKQKMNMLSKHQLGFIYHTEFAAAPSFATLNFQSNESNLSIREVLLNLTKVDRWSTTNPQHLV